MKSEKTRLRRVFNPYIVLFNIVAAGIGAFLGEWILKKLSYVIPDSMLIGFYFAVLALLIGISSLLAEHVSAKINGQLWKSQYYKVSWKYLLLSTFVMIFVVASVLQLLYGINFGKVKKINDVVLLMDMSGSMRETDPKNERLKAAEELVTAMNEENRISMFVFSGDVTKLQPMEVVTPELKKRMVENIEHLKIPNGNTNINEALTEAMKHIQETKDSERAAMVILLSDGEDNFDLKKTFNEKVEPFKENRIPIYTIGVYNSDFSLLKELSRKTGGNYFNVRDSVNLKGVFSKIYKERDRRLLIDIRNGSFENSTAYAVLRVIFIMILGAFIGLAQGLAFDNKYAAKSFALGGIIAGLVAGVLLEMGFVSFPWYGEIHRLLADIVLAVVFAIFGVALPREGERNNFNGFRNRKDIQINHLNPQETEAFY